LRKQEVRIRILKVVVFLFLFTWCLGFCGFLLPKDSPLSVISYPLFKHIYSNVCHQNELKTINDAGFNLFVCARCTGIYLSCMLISFLSVFFKLKPEINLGLLYTALILIAADVFFVTLNIYEYSKLISFITGSLLGFIIYFFFLEIIETAIGKFSVVKNDA
jgi:uncharacterized membrane protein